MPHLESGFGVGVVLVDHCVSLGENGLAYGVFFRRVESQVELGLLINTADTPINVQSHVNQHILKLDECIVLHLVLIPGLFQFLVVTATATATAFG